MAELNQIELNGTTYDLQDKTLINAVAEGDTEGCTVLGYSVEEDGDGYRPNIATAQFALAQGGALAQEVTCTGAANTTTYTYSPSEVNSNLDTYLELVVGYAYLQNGLAEGAARAKITAVNTTNKTITINKAISSTALTNYDLILRVPSIATGIGSSSMGGGCVSSAQETNTINAGNMATYEGAHAQGFACLSSSFYTHAEGASTVSSGGASHSEGYQTKASGFASHSEGRETTASGYCSHTEGVETTASGYYSHTEGDSSTASGMCSHAEGVGTTASNKAQHVFGMYNTVDNTGSATTKGTYVEIVGKGTADGARSNARTLDWSGNEWVAGTITAAGGFSGNLSGNASTATKATQDESGNNIKASYASGISISSRTITLSNKNGASLGTVTVPDTAATATKATQDESGNNIKATYAASFSISDHTITLKNKNGASLGTVTVPDNNTTYTANTSKMVTTTVPNVTSAGSAPTLQYTARSVGSASDWSAGSVPTLGTAIPADDITSWTTNTPTAFSVSGEKLSITSGTAASLSYTAKSIPNVTSVGSAPSLTITSVSCDDITSWSAGSAPTLGTAITVATGSLAANGSGASVATGITAS